MIAWRFILFVLAISLVVYLHFYLAHRQWRRLKGKQVTDIDLDYVRMENCIPQSFRLKLKGWLTLPSASEDASQRIIPKGHEHIRVTGPLEASAGTESDDILVVEGNFSCGRECKFGREIHVGGDARIGAGSQLQSLAADGNLILEEQVTIARWVDSNGEMEIGPGCDVGARATSMKAIRLGTGTRARSVFAPEVTTAGYDGALSDESCPQPPNPLEIPAPEGPPLPEEALREAGVDPACFVPLTRDCWSYTADLDPKISLHLKTRLVVKGHCHLPGGSVLEDDLKADRTLLVGAGCLCGGNLVAGGDIYLGPGCCFRGILHSLGSVFLSGRVRGFKPDGAIVVYATQDLKVAENVAVSGKLSAAGSVMVVSAAETEEWKPEEGFAPGRARKREQRSA